MAWPMSESVTAIGAHLRLRQRASQRTETVPLVRSTCNVSTSQATLYQRWERVLPLLLFFPRQRVALEIKRDLLQAECGRPEQSIKLAALVFLVLHDEGVLLTEIRFAKIRCR